MGKYSAVIFDLDGVICSTDRCHYLAWKEIADREGIAFDETTNNLLRGIGRMESLEIILRKAIRPYSPEEKQRMAEEKNELYRRLLQDMTEDDLAPAVRDTLHALRTGGLKLAIGSSSMNAETILSRIGLGNFFDAVSDGNNISRTKPDPEVFLKAAGFIGLPPAECLVVEDAKAGVDAAIAGGFDSAAMGDAAAYDKATYRLEKFEGLLRICL